MIYLLTTLHVIFCLFLILVILLQTGKGGGMGSAFGGGGSSTVFGPRGPGSFIAKLTGIVATLFMVTSMLLAYLSSSKATDLADKVAALSDVKHQGNEVDLNDIAKPEAPVVPAEKPASDASVGTADAGAVPTPAAPEVAPNAAPVPAPAAAPAPVAAPPAPAAPKAAPASAPAAKPAKPAAPKPAAPAAPASDENPY